ncbi:unnamed protein product [Lactuca virosa]|uniref:BED-type domain-containing protein n=1 Tax=Lactuca virosa TaxID=75947 RepID=A0AAU9NTW0_9ASTR|nr:unnamed protein product [Lactuca virosa]
MDDDDMQTNGAQNVVDVDAETQVNVEDKDESFAKKIKLTSDVWEGFDKIKKKDVSDGAKCKHCHKVLVAGSKSGTTHVRNHLNRCNSKNRTGIAQYMISTKKSISDDSVVIENFKFNEEKSRMDFSKMLIKHNYPFNMCEHDYFEHFVNGLQPKFHLHCRNTVKSDILRVHKNEKEKLYTYIETLPDSVSLTTDIWIAETLFRHIIDCILDWKLEGKLFSMVLDNASANDAMVRTLRGWICDRSAIPLNGKLFHVRCSAHILNLVVQDRLKVIVAVVFDPSYKMSLVEYYYNKIHSSLATSYVEKVRSELLELFNEYDE